ncbi:MAG: hypothetical protein LBU23_05135 [Planctomycetota bacterium]|nr:hypothetical protein [Planctomycetota bacterium]
MAAAEQVMTEGEYREFCAREVYLHGKDRTFTRDEIDELDRLKDAAKERGDEEEYLRLAKIIPLDPDVAMADKEVYGKEHLLSMGFDLTEADLKWGEGWLDEDNG